VWGRASCHTMHVLLAAVSVSLASFRRLGTRFVDGLQRSLYPVKASDQSNGTGSRYIEMNEQHCSSHSQKENQGGGWHLGTMPLCFVLSGRHSLSRSVTWYALDRRMTRAHACAIVGDGLLSGSHAPALTCCHISVARRLRLSIEGDALIPAASRSVAAGAAAPRKCRVSPTRVGPC
jgi:hypothetical protein